MQAAITPSNTHPALAGLDRNFDKIRRKSPNRPLQVRVFSEPLGLDYAYPAASASRPFHTASIGKLFTAVVVQRLAERRLLDLAGPIQPYFAPAELDRLFVYRGLDYASQVTPEHLLGHTSGIADYFEGIAQAVEDGRTTRLSFIDDVLTNPNRRWTPPELLDYTRRYQKAAGVPGQVFQYSDTGYMLLGLLVERVTGRPFAESLAAEIFDPLGMDDSYLMFSSEPANRPAPPIEPLWLKGVEAGRFASLSCDWAGGGVVSTPNDLLRFSRALRQGRLIPPDRLAGMDRPAHRFRPGIHYGLGMMEIRFKEFFFLLGRLPRLYGHIGILATHLFYDPAHAAHLVLNFGDAGRMVPSFRALIEIETALQKLK